jgi:hypothetical protein
MLIWRKEAAINEKIKDISQVDCYELRIRS